jgi:hypothetical protein
MLGCGWAAGGERAGLLFRLLRLAPRPLSKAGVMAFTLTQKLAYYRRNPHLRARYQRTWLRNRRRQAQIASAKAALWLKHEMRSIGVARQGAGHRGIDSWSARP